MPNKNHQALAVFIALSVAAIASAQIFPNLPTPQRMGDWEVTMGTTANVSASVFNQVYRNSDSDSIFFQPLTIDGPVIVDARAGGGIFNGDAAGRALSGLYTRGSSLQVRAYQFARAASGSRSSRSTGTVRTILTSGTWVYKGAQPADFRFRVDLRGHFTGLNALGTQEGATVVAAVSACLLYTSPSPRD